MSRAIALVGEGLRIALAQPVATAVTALIVAGVCAVIVATTGQTVAIERDVLARIDDAGTRTILIEDTDGRGGLRPDAVERVNALSDVDWAVGFGIATDVRPRGLDGAAAVPIRRYVGSLPDSVKTSPWRPSPTTALVGVDAIRLLGFMIVAGPVEEGVGTELGVVGWFRAAPPLEFLNRSLLAVASDDEAVVRIVVLASSASVVPGVAAAIRSTLDPVEPASISVQTSESLVEIRAAVQGQIGTFGRGIVTGTLAAGLALAALNVLGTVTARRRDFGRRRALGASRLDIVTLVLVPTLLTAVIGALVGTTIGTLIAQQVVSAIPEPAFIIAVGLLAIIATGIAALPPAALAAYRDPIRVLRVP